MHQLLTKLLPSYDHQKVFCMKHKKSKKFFIYEFQKKKKYGRKNNNDELIVDDVIENEKFVRVDGS